MSIPPESQRARSLLDDGLRLLREARAREAADVLGRVLLIDPGQNVAQDALREARAGMAEAARRLDQRLAEAEGAISRNENTLARALLDEVVRDGGDRDRALALLDRLDGRAGLVCGSPSAPVGGAASVEPGAARRRWSRPIFATACTLALGALAGGAAASWDQWMGRLTQGPQPRSPVSLAAGSLAGGTLGEQAVARARRMLEEGRTASALALLDSVPPDDPVYPFARQLRKRALAAPPAGGPPR